ncbi:MAG: Holliday junction branch migration protein RuvA [Methylovulum sp.]|jgi:Holliday junction DNA helicase RuvA|nr:Holliday junction branch migration protein RuvA [Methylovulum sp.]
MIAFLRGRLITKAPPVLIMDVHGVGYEMEASMTTFYQLPSVGEEVFLHTHLIVREDAHHLVAFINEAERSVFRLLIKVNGVGPKLALTILSGQTADEFYHCIHTNDIQGLIRLPGVGKKTAERLLIELRDRMPELNASTDEIKQDAVFIATARPKQEAISALCALGYKPIDASKMVQAIATEDKSCEQIIRLALQGAIK